MATRISIVALLLLAACRCNPVTPVPVTPDSIDDPYPPPNPYEDGCARLCANAARLECHGWQGSPGPDDEIGTVDDVSCPQTCRDIEGSDITTLATDCGSQATSCAGIDACLAEPTP